MSDYSVCIKLATHNTQFNRLQTVVCIMTGVTTTDKMCTCTTVCSCRHNQPGKYCNC